MPARDDVDELIRPVLDHVRDEDPGTVTGVYLYGSGATTGLRPDSDIDLLLLTREALSPAERASLVSMLLRISGRNVPGPRSAAGVVGRPFEVTSGVVDDLNPLTVTPRRDFQYGEWMRSEFVGGAVPAPTQDPDVVILLATALHAHRVLHGQPLRDFVPAVPPALLQQAQLAALPDLINDFGGDERNVLLTLARIVVTIESGEILPKDLAATRVSRRLVTDEADLLRLAGEEYLGGPRADWTRETERAAGLMQTLLGLIQQAGGPIGH